MLILHFGVPTIGGATFYFACDTAEERSRWMSQMGVSAIPAGQFLQLHQKEETAGSQGNLGHRYLRKVPSMSKNHESHDGWTQNPRQKNLNVQD